VIRYLRPALLTVIGVSSVLLVLLMLASQYTALLEKYYNILIWTNATVITVFIGLLIAYLLRLIHNARHKQYGIKILGKFALALILTGVLPGILIFTVSVQFLYRSVDSWFDVRVERALDSGLTLGREVLENFQQDLLNKAMRISRELAATPSSSWVITLDQLREKDNLEEALLVNAAGGIVAVAGQSFKTIVPTAPSTRALQDTQTHGYWQQLIEKNGGTMAAKVLVPVLQDNLHLRETLTVTPTAKNWDTFNLLSPAAKELVQSREQIFLELTANLPKTLSTNANTLMNGYRDYQEMVLTRDGLRSIYLSTLTLVLLLSMFGAMALSGYLASRISRPMMDLLEGTRKVGEGSYDMVKESRSNDEVGELTRSFNIMIAQLKSTRLDLETRGAELEEAKSYLERILSKMSSGVIVVDSDWSIVSVNPSAARIMRKELFEDLGRPLSAVLPSYFEEVYPKIVDTKEDKSDITFQSELLVGDVKPKRVIIFTRATELLIGSRQGFLLVFDDISRLASAQRMEAWSEVARRLAHEIKNPLTPIRLAAERLQFKLSDKVSGKEQAILQKATTTIVDQVTAMKQMVDDFRDYAKLGAPRYEALDLAAFISEVTALYEAANVHVALKIEEHLPLIEGDPSQLRRALHNLFSNSMEAIEPNKKLLITITLSRTHQEHTDADELEMRFMDNGPGFATQILEHAFEPYVTTKTSGTGLGLAMIKKIADEHGASINVENVLDSQGNIVGAAVIFRFRLLVQNGGKE
jgi:nitrogen fixation/metabolism regulation signal transduction histidine kinase